MPNGHRMSYRLDSGLPPSPAHTSDSETTGEEKRELRATQMCKKTIANRLFPMILTHNAGVLLNIARFL